MIRHRTAREIAGIGRAGRIVARALAAAVDLVRPGVRTGQLEGAVSEVLAAEGAEAIFRGAAGQTPFPSASCVSVNHQALHGIPGDLVVKNGDLVTIDTGCRFEGWCADAARTVGVGRLEAGVRELLLGGQRVLDVTIQGLDELGRWSDVVRRVREEVQRLGLCLIEGPAGHGIGKALHEDPVAGWDRIPEADFELVEGLVLAVEPVLTTGDGRLGLLENHWTWATIDQHPAVHCEETVAVTSRGVEILTRC